MLRRAALSVALQTALAVALVVAAVAAIAFAINAREQSERAKTAVRAAATSADDVTDPPAGVILLEYDQSDRTSWVLTRNEDDSYALDFRVRKEF